MNMVGIQLNSVWKDKEASFAKIRTLMAQAQIERGSLVVLPEMFATGYHFDVQTLGEGENGPTEQFLCAVACEYGVYMIGGLASITEGSKGKNQLLVVDPDGQTILRYAKLHPFSFAGEAEYYIPGQTIELFDWNGFSVCPFICYDLRFPEIFRHGVRRGANLFIVIANWPAARVHHWTTLLTARAIENQAYILGVNRVGSDPKYQYSGTSMIVDPRGEILSRGDDRESLITARPDHDALNAYRQEFPALKDIRSEFFKL